MPKSPPHQDKTEKMPQSERDPNKEARDAVRRVDEWLRRYRITRDLAPLSPELTTKEE